MHTGNRFAALDLGSNSFRLEIARLELDVVNARPDGADVLGARVRVAPAPARTDAGRRALR